VARRTGTATGLGARFDGEVDAFLILALSVYVAPAFGAWVLAIGAARYLFLAASGCLPWMRAPLPPRRWRRIVAAAQGIVLTVAAAEVLPRVSHRSSWSPRSPRWGVGRRVRVVAVAPPDAARDQAPASDVGQGERGPLRQGIAVAVTVLALLLAGAPSSRRTAQAAHRWRVPRLPSSSSVVVAVAVLLPPPAPRAGRGRGHGCWRCSWW